MSGGQGKWTEVQRRKRSTPVNAFSDTTSNIVSGMANATTKMDILEDIWKLEGDMQNVICASKPLSVNIVRYGRNRNPISTSAVSKSAYAKPSAPPPPPPPLRHSLIPPRPTHGGSRRSYADVTTGLPVKPEPALDTPIFLSECNAPKNWLIKNVLVGEVLSIDHMASLPSGIHGDDIVENLRYIGGLNVALCFKDQLMAQ
ncbi:hypothetical protein LXL04_032757 [Taraxacum kok-saghyz]